MLNQRAFGNALALTAGLTYVVFYLISLIAPSIFKYLWNAQFLGADAASLFNGALSVGSFIGILVTIVIMSWIMGYLVAFFYNISTR